MERIKHQAIQVIIIITIERHRRSKNELEGRIFFCDCGKSYLSQPALNNHKKTKHPEIHVGNGEKRGRGRPRKYVSRIQAYLPIVTKYSRRF